MARKAKCVDRKQGLGRRADCIALSSAFAARGNPPKKWLCRKLEFSRHDKPRGFTIKKSRYSEAQIVAVLKEAENGVPVSELCRTHPMSSAAF
jgi:putative transposase